MKINTKKFLIKEGHKVKLNAVPTCVEPLYSSKKDYRQLLAQQTKRLTKLQQLHYAFDRYSILFIFQAMDAAGKDGAIKHVMSGINPQGCQVFSFKQPSVTDLDHDFLWRTNQCLPERGRIGIFNRSYYEEVLVARVHPNTLLAQALPDEHCDPEHIWKHRFRSIVDHERHLHHNGTRVVKFFLHLSKAEQKNRFIARIDNPDKNWKFRASDILERKFWDDYMHAYEECLNATSTKNSPWYIVPADDKKNARLIISEIVLDTFRNLDMSYPETSEERKEELLAIRELLINET